MQEGGCGRGDAGEPVLRNVGRLNGRLKAVLNDTSINVYLNEAHRGVRTSSQVKLATQHGWNADTVAPR